ncbi:MAG: sigma-70 family RNA polymerase sigma factor [Oscillospiraceae bacterium]|nr:sigma-70 family RNA polymerase sigma factor [Oscillospiraceae bacterium]
MTREEEKEVIGAVLSGDKDAYEKLVLEYHKSVYNIALRMTGSPEDACDITQDVFFKAYRSLKHFRGSASFGSWIYRVASNMSIDHLRRRKRQHTAETVYLDDSREGERPAEIPDVSGEPYGELERKEMRRAVCEGLDMLPEEQKLILVLREVNGLSYTEIAETLKIELSTVKSRLYRARARLADCLLKKGNFFETYSSNKRKGG